MAYANTTYPGGGGNVRTQAGFGPGPGGDGPDMSWLWDLAQRRAQSALQRDRLENKAMRQSMDAAAEDRRAAKYGRGPTPVQDPNRRLREEAEREQLMASMAGSRAQYGTGMTGGMPTRTVSGPGVIPGLTPDTMKMSGAQRQAFLPGSAVGGSLGFESTPSGMEAGAYGAARGQQRADLEGIQGMMRAFPQQRPGPMRQLPGRTSQGWPVRPRQAQETGSMGGR